MHMQICRNEACVSNFKDSMDYIYKKERKERKTNIMKLWRQFWKSSLPNTNIIMVFFSV